MIKHQNHVLQLLPGYPANGPARMLSEYELKHALFSGVSLSLQQQFRDAGFKIAAVTLADMEGYFEDLHDMELRIKDVSQDIGGCVSMNGGWYSDRFGNRDVDKQHSNSYGVGCVSGAN